MKVQYLWFSGVVFAAMGVSNAHAHLGHVGELAGHSHWIGIGAIVVAGAIAVAAAKIKKENSQDTDEKETEPSEPKEELA